MYQNNYCNNLLELKYIYPLLSGPDLPSSKRLPGPYADSGPSRAGQRHWPAGAPLPAAERFTSVPGPAGGAVPQAHVPLLTLWGIPLTNAHLKSVLIWPRTRTSTGLQLLLHSSQWAISSRETDPESMLLPEWWWQDGKFGWKTPHGLGHDRSTLGVS